MKKLMILAVTSAFVGTIAMAADEEHSVKKTKDRGHNIITGTDSETTTVTKKAKDAKGATHEMKHKKTVKTKTDGSKEVNESKDTGVTPAE